MYVTRTDQRIEPHHAPVAANSKKKIAGSTSVADDSVLVDLAVTSAGEEQKKENDTDVADQRGGSLDLKA